MRLTAPFCVSRDVRCTLGIAEILESGFADIAEGQPEVLARHCTEAGLIEKAAEPLGQKRDSGRWRGRRWSKQLSSFSRAPSTKSRPCQPHRTALRREQIRLQVALTNASARIPVKELYGARRKRKAAAERARSADRAGWKRWENLRTTPCCCSLPSTASGSQTTAAFNGDVVRELAAQFLTLKPRSGTGGCNSAYVRTSPHGRFFLTRYRQRHARPRAFRSSIGTLRPYCVSIVPWRPNSGQDVRVSAILSYRSLALWVLGYPGRGARRRRPRAQVCTRGRSGWAALM